MKTLTFKSGALFFAATLMSLQVSAASFAKYDGIDGESKDSKPTVKVRQLDKSSTKSAQPGSGQTGAARLLDKSSTKSAGLLLPAVQKVRAAADKPQKRKVSRKKAKPQVQQGAKRKGNVEYNWKVEKGEK